MIIAWQWNIKYIILLCCFVFVYIFIHIFDNMGQVWLKFLQMILHAKARETYTINLFTNIVLHKPIFLPSAFNESLDSPYCTFMGETHYGTCLVLFFVFFFSSIHLSANITCQIWTLWYVYQTAYGNLLSEKDKNFRTTIHIKCCEQICTSHNIEPCWHIT